MKRLWVVDLALAASVPLVVPALAALVSHVFFSDPYEHPYYVLIDPLGFAPLVSSFLLAAAWSYRRPSRALRAQLIPAVTLVISACFVIYLLAKLPEA